jgi:hypothetical protein
VAGIAAFRPLPVATVREDGTFAYINSPGVGNFRGPKIYAAATGVSFSEQSTAERPPGLVQRDNDPVDVTIERGGAINTVI